ncbi:TauD/TfdA family dioxygenase [Halomonas sp. MCCC 1A17488]|uniref:TauD/TfdA family dioxygenase n=1 Tax=unclassified Halomonas TaxID=2609666 RepID=UPI0018D209FC|nr:MULTISPECIES: TauD/TfdA family dioxygenase [unclassified Halomonas]MCE8016246.1 TauD/TfdA family dioxygenase [Halomonas sp. MCCC 1A17488]MCG3239579.1 TauD/TfdA family dioxygenase [Halomonas sp. MCCC 1A17488]QPP50505.1 TauD/TfdA family dioxygenase [Halomonas sp. SS10-MC5]
MAQHGSGFESRKKIFLDNELSHSGQPAASAGSSVGAMPKAWRSKELTDDHAWVRELSTEERKGLIVGLAAFENSGKPLLQSSAQDFPFDNLVQLLADVRQAVSSELGFVVLRGLPIESLTVERIRALYWGLCNHLGVLRPQGVKSELIGDVRDAGGNYRSASGRGYNTNARLDYHTDMADLVSLLCINAAKAGGESRIACSISLKDEIASKAPELFEALCRNIHYSRKGEESPEEAPYYAAPIFSERNGFFCCRYVRNHIRYAHEFDGVPHPDDYQVEAMDILDRLVASDEFTFEMTLQPGDMQILNNHVILHSRTDFDDFEEESKKRHLLRAWISTPYSQPLSPALEAAYHDVGAGAVRGGILGQQFDEAKRGYTKKAAQFHGMPYRIPA